MGIKKAVKCAGAAEPLFYEQLDAIFSLKVQRGRGYCVWGLDRNAVSKRGVGVHVAPLQLRWCLAPR